MKDDRLILGPRLSPGSFDSHSVDSPFVFTLGGRTGMTIVGWDGIGYQTGLSWLEPGQGWSAPRLVFGRDPDSERRRFNAAITSILRSNDLFGSGELVAVDGWYYATYHAYPSEGYEAGPGVIGVVRSRDLLGWEEYGGVLDPADGRPWERGGLYKSWLLAHDGMYWLFYNAKNDADEGWFEQTGVAVSRDLSEWTRVGAGPVLPRGGRGAFDELFASDPCVLKVGDTWVMFYFGLGADGKARNSYATSTDLLHWTKSGVILVDVGPEGSLDETFAHKPAMLWRDGALEHYYCAVAPLAPPVDIGGFSQNQLRGIARATSRRDDEDAGSL